MANGGLCVWAMPSNGPGSGAGVAGAAAAAGVGAAGAAAAAGVGAAGAAAAAGGGAAGAVAAGGGVSAGGVWAIAEPATSTTNPSVLPHASRARNAIEQFID